MPKALFPLHYIHSQSTPRPSWDVPCDQFTWGWSLGLSLPIVLHWWACISWEWTEWKSSRGTELGTRYLFVHFAWKERWSEERVHTKSSFGWVVGLGKNTSEKSKGLRKRYEVRPLNGRIWSYLVFHVNAHQRVEEDFTNQMDRTTHSVDIGQPPSPATPGDSMPTEVAILTAMEVIHLLLDMDLCSPRVTWPQLLLST